MNLFELGDGTEFVSRPAVSEEPMAWEEDVGVEQWREILLQCSEQLSDEEEVDEETDRRATELEAETQASFCDGLNTGFYINAYTTKQRPSMEGVLEEMRRGLERLQKQRAEEQAKLKKSIAGARGESGTRASSRRETCLGRQVEFRGNSRCCQALICLLSTMLLEEWNGDVIPHPVWSPYLCIS